MTDPCPAPSPAPAAAPEAQPAPEATRARTAPAPAAQGRREETASTWRTLASAGDYQKALASLSPATRVRMARTAPAAELLEVSDVARLAGNAPAARGFLQALRRRFPATSQASIAAFTLGRIAFEQDRNWAGAANWFSQYLRETPTGPLAGDAWGRLLEARARDNTPARAAEDARLYLQRFPRGPYAALARRLLDGATPAP